MSTYSLTPELARSIDEMKTPGLINLIRTAGRELELRGCDMGETNEDYQTLLDTYDYASDRLEKS